MGEEKNYRQIVEALQGKIDDYICKVWKSGVLMKLAKADKEKRKTYIKMAEKIIKSDKRLVIRKKQLKKLKENI